VPKNLTIRLIFLAVLTLFAHAFLIPIGFAFMDSDDSTVAIVTRLFREGYWSAFYLEQPYGGTTLTIVRTVWVALWENLFPGRLAHVTSQMTFTYGVTPIIWTWTLYLLARAYTSERAALFAGYIAAIGFNYWLEQFERDFYMAYMILGSWLLTLRAGYAHPVLEMSRRRLFLFAVIGGLAYYTCRASIIFISAAFVPWFLIRDEATALVRWKAPARARWAPWIRGLIVFFMILFSYVQIFGRNLGTWFGHLIKINAAPNLKFAILLAAIFAFGRNGYRLSRETWQRLFIVGAGFVLGFMPELTFVPLHDTDHPKTWLSTYVEAIQSLIDTPWRWIDNVSDVGGPIRYSSFALSLAAFGALAVACRRGNQKLQPIAMTAALTVIAFAALTQVPAPPRYLIPLFPPLLVSMAVLIDMTPRLHISLKWIVGGLFALHLGYQAHARVELLRDPSLREYLPEGIQIVDTFKQAKVPIVITDEYWQSNQFTFLSQCDPCFFSDGRPLGHPIPFALQFAYDRAGIMLMHEYAQKRPGEAILRTSAWKISPITDVGQRKLYTGTRFYPE
jgi:hypothetical protein